MKTIFKWLVCGIVTTVGAYVAQKAIDTCENPVKRASIKRRINNIKEALVKTSEET